MGIKDLWSILQPYCERKSLIELQGKRVAIDLSGWVCQAQCIADYHVHPKMYLRNLYFRTCFLILHDVQTVFVLEGKAPTLKYKTIAARNEIQFKGAKPQAKQTKQNSGGRTRFDHVLKQCKEMLTLMGLVCITGEGEAEAMCAHLNKQQLVEGCISQDSDCFAYGANIVYRNFSISMQGNHASSAGCVDVYNLTKSQTEIDFGRNKVIALALICGSDYNEGIAGVGKESALKFFATIPDTKILQEIRSWRTNTPHYDQLEQIVNDNTKCTACLHSGKKTMHARNGCSACKTHKGCNLNQEYTNIRLKLQIRAKAITDNDFPNEELLHEFLHEKEKITQLDLLWKMPNIPKFIDFTCRHLQWEEIYAFEKIFPIYTRWLVNNFTLNNTHTHPASGVLTLPEYIKKKRTLKGIPCYEIVWTKEQLLPLIPPEQIVIDHDKLFVSIEPQQLVEGNFPDLTQKFQASKKKVNKKKMKQTSIKVYTNATATTSSKDDSLFDDIDDDADLSLIVQDICDGGVPSIFQTKIEKLNENAELHEGSFFGLTWNENEMDAFECSMLASHSDDDDDVED